VTERKHLSESEVLVDRIRAALWGRYEVGAEIGRGAAAVVVQARDLKHDRDVAIKVLRPDIAESVGADRFVREIRLAARLSHPHIIALFDSGEAGGLLYYVMPLVEGESLRALLTRERQLALDEALRITRDVARGLQYSHEHGVFHRDVKPENILLTPNAAAISDFGLARVLLDLPADQGTGRGMAIGTAAYMSPEQASADPVDGRSDQYALACVLYEMLVGEPPFTAKTVQGLLARHRSDPPPRIRSARDSIPEAIDEAVHRALAKLPADRFSTVAEFTRALEGALTSDTLAHVRRPTSEGAAVSARRRRTTVFGVAALGFAAVLAVWQPWRATREPSLDSDRVAVAPFDLLGVADTVWRYGLVDVFARNFDGAGPLRTVPASAAIRGWQGRADPASAEALGRRTGAALVIFGQLQQTGADTVRLQVTMWDVARRRSLADVGVSGPAQRVVLLADSVTILALRELNRSRAITAVVRASLGSTSLPALKLFLQGEQLLRRNELLQARDAYARTIAQDSAFALGYRRMRSVLRALGLQSEFDSVSYWYALRAGALNRSLSPRDSLLIVADSLLAALPGFGTFYDVDDLTRLRRRFHALETAALHYPDDAEIWYELAEARHHFGERIGVSQHVVLDAFARSLALDPEFAPAYYHAVELALTLDGPTAARQLIGQYLSRVNSADARYRILDGLLDPARRSSRSLQALIDTTDGPALFDTYYLIRRWPDSAQTAVNFYTSMARRPPGRTERDSSLGRWWMSYSLVLRGRLREALKARHATETTITLVEMALRGVIPTDSSRAIFAGWLEDPNPALLLGALVWWADRRDTVTLNIARRRFAELRLRARQSAEKTIGEVGTRAVEAYLRLVRADSAGAITQLATIPDSLCPASCLHQRLTHTRLLIAAGRAGEAAELLDRHPPSAASTSTGEMLWTFERGRAALLTGERERARVAFQAISQAWDGADPELQPLVAEARRGLALLRR
jgi:serine/threonine-protein kinase